MSAFEPGDIVRYIGKSPLYLGRDFTISAEVFRSIATGLSFYAVRETRAFFREDILRIVCASNDELIPADLSALFN